MLRSPAPGWIEYSLGISSTCDVNLEVTASVHVRVVDRAGWCHHSCASPGMEPMFEPMSEPKSEKATWWPWREPGVLAPLCCCC